MAKQKIKCSVEDCKHQNEDKNECKLSEINVCPCGCMKADDAQDTMCDSYECKNKKED